jgi:hypothetical protein
MNSSLISVILVLISVVALAYALSGTVAILRTAQLSHAQKCIQAVLVWVLPFVGPLMVLHLLADRDAEAIPAGWSTNEEINSYVWQALTGHTRLAYKAAISYVHSSLIESGADALQGTQGESSGDGD